MCKIEKLNIPMIVIPTILSGFIYYIFIMLQYIIRLYNTCNNAQSDKFKKKYTDNASVILRVRARGQVPGT